MKIGSADDLFQVELQHLYSVETQLARAMPHFIKNARSNKLRDMLSKHLEETKGHAKRLEDIGAEIDISFDSKKDIGIKAILEEGEAMLNEVNNEELKDTVIIEGSEKVEYYEMAAYESAITLAKKLGMDEVADMLHQTYSEEKKSADLLKGMVQGGMNEFAETINHAAL